MIRVFATACAAAGAVVMLLWAAPSVMADGPQEGVQCFYTGGKTYCLGSDGKYHEKESSSSKPTEAPTQGTIQPGTRPTGPSKADEIKQKNDAIQKQNDEERDRYNDEIGAYEKCVGGSPTAVSQANCPLPTPPNIHDLLPTPGGPGGKRNEPTFTPPDAAWYVIRTRLVIPTLTVGVGPSPEASRWNMAVVGYPYWLWADGPKNASAEADAGGLHVSMVAHISKLYFDMGDGHRVSCAGSGTPYVRWQHTHDQVPKASPTCGYRWATVTPQHEDRTVTMTAVWAVDWEAGATSGTEYVVSTAIRAFDVGELQTVIVQQR